MHVSHNDYHNSERIKTRNGTWYIKRKNIEGTVCAVIGIDETKYV
jgi:hypothetical protein